MYIKNNKTTLFLRKDKELTGVPILFIHGFTGSSKLWSETRKKLNCPSIAIDVPGHGKSIFNDLETNYSYKDFRSELYLSLKKINVEKIHLCGYSMGGRLAVSFAQRYPEFIETLILESSSLGISNYAEKTKKYEDDILLSNDIINSLEDFNTKWAKHDLFIDQKKRNMLGYELQKSIRQSHVASQLAKSLLSFSKGAMPSFEESFIQFNFPVFLINGHDDTKYIKLNRDIMKMHKKSRQFIVNNSSHNVHLENNDDYVSTLNNILTIVS